MCEYTDRIQKLVPVMSGRSVNDLFSAHVMARFPYSSVMEGYCPVSWCGRPLSLGERRPYGRTTRSLCRDCYGSLILSRVNSNCFICDRPLPDMKIRAQRTNSREIAHNIHDRECIDYFTLIHCKVVAGVAMGFHKDDAHIRQSPHALLSQYMEPEVLEGEVIDDDVFMSKMLLEENCRKVRALSLQAMRLLENAMKGIDSNSLDRNNNNETLTVIDLPKKYY